MRTPFQELLLKFPLHALTFSTPLPKELIYYDDTCECIPDQGLEQPTLLILTCDEEYRKLNDKKIVNSLIQDSNLAGIVISIEHYGVFEDDIFDLFRQCLLPVIQLSDSSLINIFKQPDLYDTSFSQLSEELVGIMGKGFTEVVTELAKAINTPILYYDENHRLLWETGPDEEIKNAKRWVISHIELLEKKQHRHLAARSKSEPFEIYPIKIGGFITQAIVISAHLADWQKKMMDKFIGLSALLLQTEGILHEQQERMKEHFVYDLLYYKFESQKEMIKQGKNWGWNLEKPHHLMLINIDLQDVLLTNVDWMAEMIVTIESQKSEIEEPLIFFPFQDHIVVMLEDEKDRSMKERKKLVSDIATMLLKILSSHWPEYRFKIGIGKWCQDSIHLNKSFQEAKLALEFGQIWQENKSIYHINDLGILRLLTYVHQEILFDFCQEYLSLLEESDRMNGTEYINTLKAYIQHQGIINEISETMHVHPNTLRNRIKRMEEITGIDFQDSETFINLVIAVKIFSLKK